jgi:hypothetical protein
MHLNSFFSKFLLQVVVFLYIYFVPFKGLPFGPYVLFAIAGCVIMLYDTYKIIQVQGEIFIRKQILLLFFIIFLLTIVTLVTLLFNGTNDAIFIKYCFLILVRMPSSYFVIRLLKRTYGYISLSKIAQYIVNTVMIQLVISVCMFFSPSIANIFESIQTVQKDDLALLEASINMRLHGFGINFFGAGVVNGFALLLIPQLLWTSSNNNKKMFYYSFAFLAILIVGMMMARTTMVGGLFALALLLGQSLRRINYLATSTVKFFGFIILIPALFIGILMVLSPGAWEQLTNLSNFAFESFINYFEGNGFVSQSTDQLASLYVFPTSLKTYLIGDGHFADPNNPSLYYMHTDVGFLRLIFYFGIIGITVYAIMNIVILNLVYETHPGKITKLFLVFCFFFIIAISFKGFYDFLFLFMLFCWNDKNIPEKKYTEPLKN